MSNGTENGDSPERLKVVIVGSGLAGLACAISCRREGQEVLILEKSPELSEVGAGIQLPPNATKVMQHFGLLDRLYEAGMDSKEDYFILRWKDGSRIAIRPGSEWASQKFGNKWHVMHRADYQRVLVEEVGRLGAQIRLNCDVVGVECNDIAPVVILADGERITGDIVVGADGIRSSVRQGILGYIKEPEESGDLAYRITIPRELLENETDPFVSGIINRKTNAIWWGPDMHVVIYGIRHEKSVNLVLICPDDIPAEVSRQAGDLAEMYKLFEGWDPRLMILLSKVDKALKWKIWVMEELDTWTKGSVALLGDACHPSVPYAASGAAMAVEDGAVLGRLAGLFARSGNPRSSLPALMQLYQDTRKKRATTVVQTATSNRELYHMRDGPKQQKRDRLFEEHDWSDEKRSFPWVYADLAGLHDMYGFDALKSADDGFARSDFCK